MTIRVAHLVKKISGTSIPVEIADKINMLSGITSDIISISKNELFPDIVNKKNVVINVVHSVNDVLDFLIENEYDIVNTQHNIFSKESRKIFIQLNKSKIVCVDPQVKVFSQDNEECKFNSTGEV